MATPHFNQKNLAGQRFGLLTAIEPCGRRQRRTLWRCHCECGTTCEVVSSDLLKGGTNSCGCLRMQQSIKAMVGRRFGRLVVLAFVEMAGRRSRWLCRCECETAKVIDGGNLRSGGVRSCGCLQKEKWHAIITKHGGCGTAEYKVWSGMNDRCHRKKNKRYSDYGGRGITVCKRWRRPGGFPAFLEDMGPRPSPKHSIDRRDCNLGYSPENCKWGTEDEQRNNRRNNVRLTWRGETLTLAQWARRLGVTRAMLSRRYLQGWSPEEILETPCLKVQVTERGQFLRTKAHQAVRRAVKDGLLPRVDTLACSQCERPARHYHHHNGYEEAFWIDVIPLCIQCHGREE